eukprot:496449-Rhodomonas_salina.1
MKIEQPRHCCWRVIAASMRNAVPHTKNGCKVCVYKGGERTRVFVMCFGCVVDRQNVPEVCMAKREREYGVDGSLWPWAEIVPADAESGDEGTSENMSEGTSEGMSESSPI